MGLQNKPVIISSNPVEIDKAVEDIRVSLSALSWVSNPYFIAQRFHKQDSKGSFVYPETYCRIPTDGFDKYDYARLTPDNDYSGMFFFMVGNASYDEFNANDINYLKYPVSVIFSVNLKLINSAELDNGLFTQNLIKEARQLLKTSIPSYDFNVSIVSETRDLEECYKEFRIDDLASYNRAPLQCFRFDLLLEVAEECP